MQWPVAFAWLEPQLAPEGAGWLEACAREVSRGGLGGPPFARAWAACGRRLGRQGIAPPPGATDPRGGELGRGSGDVLGGGGAGSRDVGDVPGGSASPPWIAADGGRLVLLLAGLGSTRSAEAGATSATSEAHSEERLEEHQMLELFRKGELGEQQALLKALPHLPHPERWTGVAEEAVRTNAAAVLEALACHNPYPALHLAEGPFHQMILKVLFWGLPLPSVVGLPARRSLELQRMVAAFVSEWRVAGRPLPAHLDRYFDLSP